MIKKLLPLIILTLFSTQVRSQHRNVIEHFASEYLKESIPYQVLRSEGFKPKMDSVSLIVLLDGDGYSGTGINTIDLYEHAKKINPTVIISLPSTIKYRWKYFTPTKEIPGEGVSHKELYQYTGHFLGFANFVDKELIPSIEKKYQIKFTSKTIFGHSLGGLGVLNFAVLKPEIFDNYISASPSTMYDKHFIFKTIEENGKIEFNNLFLSAAENDNNGYRPNVEWLTDYLKNHKIGDQELKSVIYEDKNHTISGIHSLIDGIDFLSRQNAL